MRILPLAILFLFLFSGCFKTKDQAEIDDQLIQNYIKTNNLNAVKDISGLYYISFIEGTGGSPTATSTIEVKYRGYLLSGTIFDATATDKTFSSQLSDLLVGWQKALPLMKKGGKASIILPSALGYGPAYVNPIPPNSVIAFDIELIDVR